MSYQMKPIAEIAKQIGLDEGDLYFYGPYKAKINPHAVASAREKPKGKQVLVTATTPTPAGEGKTTTAIGLSMGLNKIGVKSVVTLREPSLGPVFGIKGGATGGGKSLVLPEDEIDMHFTGDIHAVTTANNLLAAMLDNHIHHSNRLDIDVRRITWPRVMDMNDRALRNIAIGLGGVSNGFPREDNFIISVASEIMAILCLADDFDDMKKRLGRIVVGYTRKRKPVTADDLKAVGAMALVLKDAIKPNIVQTNEGTPAIIHGGPFANIAHGTNSIQAIRLAQAHSDITITEAGFASDLGGEKFLDFVSQVGDFNVDSIVLVTTLRALKYHGGVEKKDVAEKNNDALVRGFENLDAHIEIMGQYGVPVLVAVNKFDDNDDEELKLTLDHARGMGVDAVICDPFGGGGDGCIELAEAVTEKVKSGAKVTPIYSPEMPIREKIEAIAKKVYGAETITYSRRAERAIDHDLTPLGFDKLHVIVAKTQASLSGDKTKRGRPRGFNINVDNVYVNAGAGFVVAVCGDILLMPGLPTVPSAEGIDIDAEGNIVGLF
ncbi:MAG TPA: formate--tetrahydrofolate ligase [candidate division Zixibacteria bacterium]|nr:formate--tetrahydrofolate ligase [candidate division Zixibacteria bacterium]